MWKQLFAPSLFFSSNHKKQMLNYVKFFIQWHLAPQQKSKKSAGISGAQTFGPESCLLYLQNIMFE